MNRAQLNCGAKPLQEADLIPETCLASSAENLDLSERRKSRIPGAGSD
jgi:hypothetical protein